MNTTEMLGAVKEQYEKNKILMNRETPAKLLPQGTAFFMLANVGFVTGEIRRDTKVRQYNRLRVTKSVLSGVSNLDAGYLFDNGTVLSFVTSSGQIYFSIPLNELIVELHSEGLLITDMQNQTYLIGKFSPMVKGDYPAETKNAFGVGGGAMIWLKRFADLGIVDPGYFLRKKRNTYIKLAVGLAFMAIVAALVLGAGE